MRFGTEYGVNEQITSNISQNRQTFSFEIFMSWSSSFRRDLFKYLFHIILIGTTTPQFFFAKTLRHVYMKLTLTQIERR